MEWIKMLKYNKLYKVVSKLGYSFIGRYDEKYYTDFKVKNYIEEIPDDEIEKIELIDDEINDTGLI